MYLLLFFSKGVGLGDLEFACIPNTLAIGNLIFKDNNKDGKYTSGTDTPVPSVAMELYAVVNGIVDVSPIATTTTNASGLYLFSNLVAGQYVVKIAASNFQTGAVLYDWVSSTGAGTTGDDNADENGIDGDVTLSGIASNIISLTINSPSSTAEDGVNGTSDDANDGYTDLTIDFGLIPSPSLKTCNNFNIATGLDDGYELSGGVIADRLVRTLSYLGTGLSSGTRFTGVNIPQGATITSARVIFTANTVEGTGDAVVCNLTIQGEAADNAAAFDGAVNFNITGRTDVASSVNWTINNAWAKGQSDASTTTPDLSAIIQQIVNRPGWASGNALALAFVNVGATNGQRIFETFEGDPTKVARLEICYAPTITNPSATQTVCQGATSSNITVNTTINDANSIRFVKFSTDQSAVNGTETATELANIYAGTAISTVTPTGASNPYTATYTFSAADFPTAGTYYVYAILNPDPGATCRPVQEIKIVITPSPSAITLSQTAPTCTGAIANNNGKITFISVTGADKYYINTGATSSGTYVGAITIPASGVDLQTSIPNTGATYTIRFYNGSDACYKDTTVVIGTVICCPTITNPSTDLALCWLNRSKYHRKYEHQYCQQHQVCKICRHGSNLS
jgi:SdrD B-like domain